MFRSPSSRSTQSSPQQGGGTFKRAFKTSFTGSISSKSVSEVSLDGESPLVILRVQVIGCRDLPSADLNGKSDPYVTITFGGQKVKTPVIKKNLNPKWVSKDATFDIPIFAKVVEERGALLDIVVWDKDLIGKDYLADCSLGPSQWVKRKSDPGEVTAYAFDDAKNNPLSFPLSNQKPRKSRSSPTTGAPTIQLKIGLVQSPDATESPDFEAILDSIQQRASQASDKLLSIPPSQALGAVKAVSPTPSRQTTTSSMGTSTSADAPKPPPKESFRINWEGTHINYDFGSKKSIAGIILLEVQDAKELPKTKNFTRTGFDMDPFIVIKYNDELYRTKVIRHDLNPTFNDKFILYVRRSGQLSHGTGAVPGIESSTVLLSLLDWEQMSKNRQIGSAVLNLESLIDAAPKPDAETGLYSVEAMRLHNFSDVKLDLGLVQKDKWEGKPTPTISVRAKYEPNAAMRQRYWRSNLKDFDKDHTGQLSHAELLHALEETGLDVDKDDIDRFFAEQQKNPTSDELTIEEAMICLEKEYGVAAQIKAEQEEAAVAADLTKEDDSNGSPTRPSLAAVTARPPRSSMFGHSRESIYDLEQQLKSIFMNHPKAYYLCEEDKENGDAVVPASAILSILATFSELHEVDLLAPEDQAALQGLVDHMPDTEVGPTFLLTFLAKATGTDDPAPEDDADHTVTTPLATSPQPHSPDEQADDEDDHRGRSSQDNSPSRGHSRDSSRDSVQTSYRMGPGGPETPKAKSVFDVRERSTPLGAVAPPSSWAARPQPASRRRKSSSSSIGMQSEGEEASPKVTTFGRPRAPSNPVTPARLPPFSFPDQRHHSDGQSSPDESPAPRPPSQTGFRSLRLNSRGGSVSQPSLPFGSGHSVSPERMGGENGGASLESSRYGSSALDDDDDGFEGDRFSSDQTSLFSVETTATGDRLEDLERLSEEQAKKLKELQRTLEEKMANHELEMEEMLVQKEELEAELASSKRDEKEYRLKDNNSTKQLNALESEVSRLQKELDASRSSYQSLQKLYQEQCSEAEKYRDALRRKDMELKDSEKYVGVIASDVEKWQATAETAQERVETLNKELDAARNALESLDRQKHENLGLKETIDRLRFEMDELRNSNAAATGSAGVSRAGTMAPSLAAELQQRLLDQADADREKAGSGDENQDEDYVETVITRRKLAKKPRTPPDTSLKRVQDMFRDYADASAQHDPSEYTTDASTQATFEAEPSHAADASSSTAGPSTLGATPVEAPPAYSKLLEEEKEKIGLAEVAKWHSGHEGTDPLPQGISSDVVAEWQRVKAELGFSCQAIDEVVAKSHVNGPRPSASTPKQAEPEDVPGGLESWSTAKWTTILGIAGGVCLLSFVSGYGIASLLRNRPARIDGRLWDMVNDIAKAGTFPDLLHRPPLLPWGTIKNVQDQFLRPNWEPV